MLPKISHPIFDFTIPSTKKKETFRPFLVKEEKILLMAKTTDEQQEQFRAIKQVVNNCAIDPNFDVDKLTLFDLEYVFLQIRAVSVNGMVTVSYRDNEDQKVYDFDIDITKVEVKFPEKTLNKIKVNKSIGILMKYPSASVYDDKQFFATNNENSMFELVIRCIDKIYDSDDVYDPANYTKDELIAFLGDLSVETFEKIQEFINNMPRLEHKLEYKNSNGNTRTITLNSLTDFFTLG
jgi:hypothetical protein